MTELRSLGKERGLVGYSRLRKAELVAFIQSNESKLTNDNFTELTKRQLKRRRSKNSKLSKKFKSLTAEIEELKNKVERLEDRISSSNRTCGAKFKRKKIRSRKREVNKVVNELRNAEENLEKINSRRTTKDKQPSHKPTNRKIAELNRKIRRAKNNKTKNRLITKKELLKLGPRQLNSAFGNAYRSYRINGIENVDLYTFLNKAKETLMGLLTKETSNESIRFQATTWISFVKDGVQVVELAFNSKMVAIYKFSEMDKIVKSAIDGILQLYENPALRNSKFVFDRVLRMDVSFHRLNLTRGSSYTELGDWLASKKAIINPRNSDNQCFKWSVIAGTYFNEIGRDCQRVSKLRKYEKEFDWYGIDFPTSYKDIKRFESMNEITVNVLAVEDKKIYICRKGKEYDRVVNLMLITDENRKHYVAIKSLSRLLSKQNSKDKQSQHFCTNCLQGFSTESAGRKHYDYRKDNDVVRIEVPKDPTVEYRDDQNQFKIPFMHNVCRL